jgi:hypothetical protein
MEWIIASVFGLAFYRYGQGKGWWKGPNLPFLPPVSSGPVTVDLESDMPASLKNVVLAEVASDKDPNKLDQLSTTFSAMYPQAAYALAHQAWVLRGGSKAGEAEPQPPTAAAIQASAIFRAASAAQAAVAAQAAAAQAATAPQTQTSGTHTGQAPPFGVRPGPQSQPGQHLEGTVGTSAGPYRGDAFRPSSGEVE